MSVLMFSSCSDDNSLMDKSKENIEARTKQSYNPRSITSKNDAHKAIGYAFSKLLHDEPTFKQYLLTNLVRETIVNKGTNVNINDFTNQGGSPPTYISTPSSRLKDLLLYDIVIADPVKKVKINNILKQLPIFVPISDPVQYLLDIDPLIAVNMPSDIVSSCNFLDIQANHPDIEFPIIVLDYEENNEHGYINGEINIEQINNYYTCGFYVSTAIYYILANPTNLSTCESNQLTSIFGSDIMNCVQVKNQIQSKGSFGNTNCVLVDKYSDVLSVYYNNCNNIQYGPSGESGPTGPLGPSSVLGIDCPRAIVGEEKEKNWNYLNIVQNISWATHFYYDNQPCPPYNQELDFHFYFVKNYLLNGITQAKPSNEFMLRAQLINPGLGKRIPLFWELFGLKVHITPKITPETVLDQSLWEVMPSINPIPMAQELFSNNKEDNNWTPENQGSMVDIVWHEADSQTCNNNQSTSISQSYQFSYSTGVTPSGTGSVQWNENQTSMNSYSISAAAEVRIGVFQLTYCQEPFVSGYPGDMGFDKNNLKDFYFFKSYVGSSTNSAGLNHFTIWYD